jgi:hypothetical protein
VYRSEEIEGVGNDRTWYIQQIDQPPIPMDWTDLLDDLATRLDSYLRVKASKDRQYC